MARASGAVNNWKGRSYHFKSAGFLTMRPAEGGEVVQAEVRASPPTLFVIGNGALSANTRGAR